MKQPEQGLRILIVSDLEKDNDLMRNELRSFESDLVSDSAGDLREFNEKIEYSWSMLIFHSNVGFISLFEALQLVKKKNPEMAFVFISDGLGEDEVAQLMKAGAEDVISTSRLLRLKEVVKRVAFKAQNVEREIQVSRIAHQAVMAREQMLAIVSHDIKNPLSAIELEAQMLIRVANRQEKSLFAEDIKVQAARILKTTGRLKGLIGDLLDKNKTESGLTTLNKSDCDVVKLLQEVYDSNRPLIKQKNITFKTAYSSKIVLEVDKNRIFQAMNNLLSNAIKFTPEGGSIEVEFEDQGSEYLFSVKDSGPGLKSDDLNRLFDKYWTAGVSGSSGTGLGLFISKTVIEAHQGHIGGENSVKGGARFWFTLPKPQLNCSVILPAICNKPKVLVIDDDDDLREVISWAFDQEGFAVHSYSDPREALKSLSQGRHSPQLIVVDFQMESMNGTDFLKLKSEMGLTEIKHCPVVMISATPEQIDLKSNGSLIDKLIHKPIDLAALIDLAKNYINQ